MTLIIGVMLGVKINGSEPYVLLERIIMKDNQQGIISLLFFGAVVIVVIVVLVATVLK